MLTPLQDLLSCTTGGPLKKLGDATLTYANVVQTSSEVFFRKVNFWDKGGRDAPPVFNVDGVSYLYVKVRAASTHCQAMLGTNKCRTA